MQHTPNLVETFMESVFDWAKKIFGAENTRIMAPLGRYKASIVINLKPSEGFSGEARLRNEVLLTMLQISNDNAMMIIGETPGFSSEDLRQVLVQWQTPRHMPEAHGLVVIPQTIDSTINSIRLEKIDEKKLVEQARFIISGLHAGTQKPAKESASG